MYKCQLFFCWYVSIVGYNLLFHFVNIIIGNIGQMSKKQNFREQIQKFILLRMEEPAYELSFAKINNN